jgi:hypothetical protein
MIRHILIAYLLLPLSLAMGCATEATSREELAQLGLEAIAENDPSIYRDFLVTIPKLREHCSEAELHRALTVLPQAHAKLKSALKTCHDLANWKSAVLVSLRGGDVFEHALECGGRYARMSPIIATYVIDHDRYEVHHRRGYLEDEQVFLLSKQPWCTRE